MNFANLPCFILFFAAVYLLGIYGLLTIVQVSNKNNNALGANAKNSGDRFKVP